MMIIHISGVSCSGKTTLGLQIKKKFKSNVIVKDLDDLFKKFIRTLGPYDPKNPGFKPEKYQAYIDSFIDSKKKSGKILILTGLNIDMGRNKGHYYNITRTKTDKKYYIKILDDTVFKQGFNRELDKCIKRYPIWLKNNKDEILKKLITGKETKEEIFAEKNMKRMFDYAFDYKKVKKTIRETDKYYIKEKYKFMTADNILKNIGIIIRGRGI